MVAKVLVIYIYIKKIIDTTYKNTYNPQFSPFYDQPLFFNSHFSNLIIFPFNQPLCVLLALLTVQNIHYVQLSTLLHLMHKQYVWQRKL